MTQAASVGNMRPDKVRARISQDAGLGLSMVRAVCQAHVGTVEVRSEEEVGATVRVELRLVTGNNS